MIYVLKKFLKTLKKKKIMEFSIKRLFSRIFFLKKWLYSKSVFENKFDFFKIIIYYFIKQKSV